MKRIISIILSIIITIGLLGSNFAYAENSYEKRLEQAIIKAKENFNISNEYDVFDSRIDSIGKEANFYMNWSDSKGKLGYINVNTDSYGNIIGFNKYPSNPEESRSSQPNITREEGLQKSLEFISKIDGDLSKEIKVIEKNNPMDTKDREYHYGFARYVNDILFPENSVRISIDKYSEEITDYYSDWDRKLSFPLSDKAITLKEAKETYKNSIGLKPMYKFANQIHRGSNDKSKDSYYIAYSTLQSGKAIDAITGRPVDINSYRIYNRTADMETIEKSMGGGLSPEEQVSVDKLVGILEVSTIEKKAKEILKIDEGYKMKNSYLNSDYKNPGDYTWSLYFVKNIDKNKECNIEISLDAKTGELIRFYKYKSYDESAKAKINKSEALNIAKAYLKEINPDKESQLDYLPNEYSIDKNPTYNFQFVRKVDGIYVDGDMIGIGVDGISGEINSYNLNWYKGDFPSNDNIISIDKAYEVLWSEIDYELMYVNYFDHGNSEEENKTIKLVYSIKPGKPVIISGTTGEVLDYSGEPYSERKIANYKDIEKSYAKDKIRVLAEYGVSFTTDEFKPKEKIKQKDFLYLLWKSINPYRTENISGDNIYDEFMKIGYMTEKEKNPDKVTTKEEATKFIIKAMKLDKIAEIDGIYKDIFKDEKDISKDLKGYINIGYGLKIISGDGSGNIKPRQELKREDAANMIYNYLFN